MSYGVAPVYFVRGDEVITFGTRDIAIEQARKLAKTTFRDHDVKDLSVIPARPVGHAHCNSGRWEWAK